MSPKKPTTDPTTITTTTDTSSPEATTTVKTPRSSSRGRTPKVLAPAYALLGATELTVETLRALGAEGESEEKETPRRRGLASLTGEVADVARGVRKVPAYAMGELLKGYEQLTERGQRTVTGAIPTIGRARETGEARVRAEDARARREARRLARQAGAVVDRGRSVVTGAADDATRAASKVVEAVTHGSSDDARQGRRPEARRRAAVVDTSVTATSPTGGDADAPVRHERVNAGVEAGATTTARRSPRARKAAAAAAEGSATPTTPSTPSTSTTTGTARATAAASPSAAGAPVAKTTKKATKKSTPRTSTPRTSATTTSEATDLQIVKTPADDIEIPTPAEVAAAVRENDQLS